MKYLYYLTIVFITFTVFNCANDSENDLIDVVSDEPVDDDNDPDTDPVPTLITYNDDIASIISSSNCLPCHNNPPLPGTPNSLTNFREVMTSVQTNLIDRISRPTGSGGAMPLGASRLPQALIDQVIQWEIDGFLEE